MINKIVLVRHGESQWNKENRFTGWTDVDLTERGIKEAKEAGKTLKDRGYSFDIAYTSVLTRAIKTLYFILDEMDLLWIPVNKTWRLNERHYGALQGLNKAEITAKYGGDQVKIWRRGYDVLPMLLTKEDPRYPKNDVRYKDLSEKDVPLGESLKETVLRVVWSWENEIVPMMMERKKILIAAHGNSLRALIKYLENLSNEELINLNIPTGIPLVYELDENQKVTDKYYLGDTAKIQRAIDELKNQGKNKIVSKDDKRV